jgi:hypothetical protein
MTDVLSRRDADATDRVLDDIPALAEVLDADIVPRRLLRGAKRIAEYLSQPERWLRKQLERAKRPPPVFRIGAALWADADALDRWIAEHKERAARRA